MELLKSQIQCIYVRRKIIKTKDSGNFAVALSVKILDNTILVHIYANIVMLIPVRLPL